MPHRIRNHHVALLLVEFKERQPLNQVHVLLFKQRNQDGMYQYLLPRRQFESAGPTALSISAQTAGTQLLQSLDLPITGDKRRYLRDDECVVETNKAHTDRAHYLLVRTSVPMVIRFHNWDTQVEIHRHKLGDSLDTLPFMYEEEKRMVRRLLHKDKVVKFHKELANFETVQAQL